MAKKVLLTLDEDIHLRIKIASARLKVTMRDWMVDAMLDKLARETPDEEIFTPEELKEQQKKE